MSDKVRQTQSEAFGLAFVLQLLTHTVTVIHEWTTYSTLNSVYLRVIFFGCPYTCVMYGIRQCNQVFSGAEISAFFAKIFLFKFQFIEKI